MRLYMLRLAVLLASLFLSVGYVVANDRDSCGVPTPLDYKRSPYQAVYFSHDKGTLPTQVQDRHINYCAAVNAESVFSGINTFARLPWVQCLGKDKESAFDIGTIITAVVGALIVLFIYGAVTGRKGRATR